MSEKFCFGFFLPVLVSLIACIVNSLPANMIFGDSKWGRRFSG